jgi:hypothetical protein
MKKLAIAALLFGSCVALADIGFRQEGSVSVAVRDIACGIDGGLLCTRDAGTTVGVLRCAAASATEPGCVVPGDQAMPSGKKTWNGRQRIVGVTHASLTACSNGEKGTWQTCTTHNAPVFCNGTVNIELAGSTQLDAFPPVYVNGLLHSGLFVLGTFTLPYAFTITQTSGFIGAGTGVAVTQTLRYSDGTNFCDCAVDCDTDQSAVSCTGNCTYAANTLVIAVVVSDSCTTPPTVKGLLTPAGYKL